MPLSTDNQDYGQSDEKNKDLQSNQNLTTDDQKGKKVDADVEKEADKPAEQKK